MSAAAQPANTSTTYVETQALDRAAVAHAATPLPAEILRFKASERQLHWAIAMPFMVCYTTALVLVAVYNPAPMRPFRAVFSWTHRLSGVCLFLLPTWTLVRHRHDLGLHFRNISAAWGWRLEDVKWLLLIGLSTFSKRVELPDQGKFNAGEKLNFMFLTASYPLYIVTGVLIWLPGVAFASWILHLSLAAMATPLIVGHVFMATVNPDTRAGLQGMISGYVNRHWAQHHYAHWYREHFGHLHRPPMPEPDRGATAPTLHLVPRPGVEDADPVTDPAVVNIVKFMQNRDLSAHDWPRVMQVPPADEGEPESA